MDLSTLSLAGLKQLQKDVEKAITSFEARKKQEALAALKDKAAEMGFSLEELMGTANSKVKKPAMPKYRNPANPDETWSGRGRTPKWVVALEAGGTSRETALI